jgi:hypothetical protein
MKAYRIVRVFIVAYVFWFLSGIVLFPHAPIRECPDQSLSRYCGKGGVPYSEAAYQRFQVWENGLIVGFVLLIPMGIWQRRLAARGDKDAIADMKGADVLSYRSLWAIRWLSITLFALQLVAGVVAVIMLAGGRSMLSFWLGGVLATAPAYLLGLLVQHRVDPTALREHKATALALGVISIGAVAAAMVMFVGNGFAG